MIRGVGQAEVLGGSEYAMRVWVKPDQLAKLGLTVPDITRAIQEQNVIAPAGQIGGPPAAPGAPSSPTPCAPAAGSTTAEEFGERHRALQPGRFAGPHQGRRAGRAGHADYNM